MSMQAVASVYSLLLTPIPPFTWFGLPFSTLDVAAAARLCLVMRQLREMNLEQYLAKRTATSNTAPVIERSLVRDATAVLVVVYGGEAAVAPWLGITPSFMFSPAVPALYGAITAAIEYLPAVPKMCLETELPLAILDGYSRSFLLCQLLPPAVTTLASEQLSNSPWTLLLSTFMIANGGFFCVNLFSMLHPTGWSLTTPAELQTYGWTTLDLWVAPLITAIYAMLTHAQPFWADVHALVATWLGSAAATESVDGKATLVVDAVDSQTARAACATILMVLFATRTVRNFGEDYMRRTRGEKKKVMRNRQSGEKYSGKTKTQ